MKTIYIGFTILVFIIILIIVIILSVKQKEKFSIIKLDKNLGYPSPPSLNLNSNQLNDLVNNFSPIFVFSKDEKYYPVNPKTFMKWCSLRIWNEVSQQWDIIIPKGLVNEDTIIANTKGIEQLSKVGINLDSSVINDLSLKVINTNISIQKFNKKYALIFEPGTGNYNDEKKIVLSQLAGYLENPDFDPSHNKTYFHLGSPGCALLWKNSEINNCNDMSKELLELNKKIDWDPIPLISYIQHKQVYIDNKPVWVTDFIYLHYYAFNGSISIFPSLAIHVGDIETVGIRFFTEDLMKFGIKAKPLRYYLSAHAGYSWYEPKNIKLKALNLKTPRSGDIGNKTHPIIYLGRDSHANSNSSVSITRIFGVANDVFGGGVIWQPSALYVNLPQENYAHQLRLNNMKNNSEDSYFQTIIKDNSKIGNNTIYGSIGVGPNWIYYCGRISPLTSSNISFFNKARVRLDEGQCIGVPPTNDNQFGICKPYAAEPTASIGTYVSENLNNIAKPMGSFEKWDENLLWYIPVNVNCLENYPSLTSCVNSFEDCCLASNNVDKRFIYVITDVKILEQDVDENYMNGPTDYTGVRWNIVTSPFIPNIIGTRIGSDTTTYKIGGKNVGIWVKYEYLPITSDKLVLCDLIVSHWSDWKIKCPSGYIGLGRVTGGTKGSCWKNGLCMKMQPLKNSQEIVSGLAWSWTKRGINNFEQNINNQNTKIVAPLNSVDVHKGCGDDYYMHLCIGKNKTILSSKQINSKLQVNENCSIINGDGTCCIPNCIGKGCGDDGCGQSCGYCPNNKICNSDNGQCENISSVKYINFKTDPFGIRLVENINKNLQSVINNFLSKGIGSDLGKQTVPDTICYPNKEVPDSKCPCCLPNFPKDAPSNDFSPGKCNCFYIKYNPGFLLNSGFTEIYAAFLGSKGAYKVYHDSYGVGSLDVWLRPIWGNINGTVKVDLQPNDDGFDIILSTGPVELNTEVKVQFGFVSNTISGKITNPNGLKIRLNAKLKLTTVNKYFSGFIQDTSWFFPRSTDCNDKNLLDPFNPCVDYKNKSLGLEPLSKQNLGFIVRPESLLTGKEFSDSNGVNVSFISQNIRDFKINFSCSGLASVICNVLQGPISSLIFDFAENIIKDNVKNITDMINLKLLDLIVYPPDV